MKRLSFQSLAPSRTKESQRGFTLIELIVVIAILGILGATVLPKFSSLKEESELAQARNLAGNLKAGVNIVKTVFHSQSLTQKTQNLVQFGDGTIDTNDDGFPIGSDKGNGNENIGKGNAGCTGVWYGVLASPPSSAHNNNNQDYRSYRHTGNKVCSYVYRASGDLGNQNTGLLVIRYDSRNGNVDICGQRDDIPNC